jgi:hypothetical protein
MMLATAFISQIQQRFSHEKRARVCLWFDPSGEFDRLLPVFAAHLEEMKTPPFRLLSYDRSQKRGQLWLKRAVWLARQQDPQARLLIHLPFPEERMTSPDENGKNHLELLLEFQTCGVDWKVAGKRPSLFSFLKAAGVRLPDSVGEQRKITEGGAESLLSKYAAKFAARPPAFWEETVTAELAQSRLVGDVDQTVLDLAVEPDAKWEALRQEGHLDEFLAAVRERLGDTPDTDSPVLWIKGLVERLALTEAFVGYREPEDFPFADRIPPMRYRENHLNLVRRWLRDANCRGAWDRWVVEAEEHVNLASWAKGKKGACYGFPHLVTQRWQDAVDSLMSAAENPERFSSRIAEVAPDIQREVEYTRASAAPSGSWSTLLGVTRFVTAAGKAKEVAEKATSTAECLRVYLEFAGEVDQAHLRIKGEAQELGLEEIAKVIDRTYASYANLLNLHFFTAFTATETNEIPGLPFVTDQMEAHVWSAKGKRAVVIVDALRYDCALALKSMLTGSEVTVAPMRAMLPTITPFGMSALLPASHGPNSLLERGKDRVPSRGGQDLSQRSIRIAQMTAAGADCREIDAIEKASAKPSKVPPLLVVFGHEEVDSIGHGDGDALIRHLNKELERIARVVRKLHHWGYPEVTVVTDHGFVLMDEENLPPEVPLAAEWCLVKKERFAFVPAGADLPVKSVPMPWDSSVRVAVPPGFAYFKTEKSFSHGGATLQELVIPRLCSKQRAKQQKVGVEILLAGTGAGLTSAAVKLILRPVNLGGENELAAISAMPRKLLLNVFKGAKGGADSMLSRGEPKTVDLPTSGEVPVTLFFDSKFSVKSGDQLRLAITDAESGEHFPGPEGILLTASRDL